MKKIFSLVLILISICFSAQKKNQDYSFYENKGQIVDQRGNPNTEVKYLLNSPGLNVQIRKNSFSYDVYETERRELKKPKGKSVNDPFYKNKLPDTPVRYKFHRIDIDFLDSNDNVEIKTESISKDYENYYNLPHKKEGVSFVHRYKKIIYKNLYDHIDVVFFKPLDSTKPVEYNFLVHPGGKMSDIKMSFSGTKTELKEGKICMNLRFGKMEENIPNSWIENDQKQSIAVNYKNLGKQTFGFESSVNHSDKTIVIDPVPTRIWGSYFGGSGNENLNAMSTDSQDNLYAVGSTDSKNNIATAGSHQSSLNGTSDAYILAADKDGSKLWSSYYGNVYADYFSTIAVLENTIYVGGSVSTSDQYTTFPGAGFLYIPYESKLISFEQDGTIARERTYTNNYKYSGIGTIVVDSEQKKIYVSGLTLTSGFNGENIIGIYSNISGFFITKLDTNNQTEWTRLIGGNNGQSSIRTGYVNTANQLCLTGSTSSTNGLFISNDAIQKNKMAGAWSGYYTEFDKNGNQIYGTYLGGTTASDEVSFARKVGNYIIYSSFNGWIPPYGKFIRKVDMSTGIEVFSKYYPNISRLSDTDCYIDEKGNTYLWGHADTRGFFPTPNAYNHSYGDIYLMKVDSDSNTVWATYYGGYDYPTMHKGKDGFVYYAGRSNQYSFDIATSGAFQNHFAGGYADTFIAKFYDCTENQILSSEMKICLGSELKLSVISGTSYNWSGPNGFSSTIQNPSIPKASLSNAGTYSCTVTGTGACDGTFTIDVKVEDKPAPTGNPLQSLCAAKNPTLKDIKVNGIDIKWYDHLGNYLPNTTDLEDGKTYYASQTIDNCESSNRLAVTVDIVINYLSANDYSPPPFCNDTTANFKTINLDDYKKEFITNPQDYTFEFRNSSNQIVSGNVNLNIGSNVFDVKITSSLGCYQFVKLSLTLNPKPKVNLPNEAEFCDNLGVILDAGAGFSNYDWSTGEKTQTIKADKEQTYKVTVTNLFGCKNTASVIVKKAKLAEIQNILINNSNATVIMSVAGNYLYSLDQIKWQSSNKFDNLENGNYTVFVKTNLGCDLGSKTFTIFSLSNIFSPNGDNINDTWKISGIENYPNSEIKIIDKNGKMVVNVITKGETFEWNGESNGRKLPSDSYWYQIKLSDGRILEGYVVIKNRN